MIYFCPSPIGNLKDITLRTLEVLRSVDYVACEDTRRRGKLLKHFEIEKKLIQYQKFNEIKQSEKLIELAKKSDIALITDAGMPGISDPGAILVKRLIEENIEFTVLPGPNAALTALVASGLDTEHFYFYGFLDSREGKREKELESLKSLRSTIIFYEAPHRIIKTLKSIEKILGDRKVSLSRELTKIYEENLRGKVSEILEGQIKEKGEFVIVVEGSKEEEVFTLDIKEELRKLIDDGMTNSQAVKEIADKFNLKKNTVYKESLDL